MYNFFNNAESFINLPESYSTNFLSGDFIDLNKERYFITFGILCRLLYKIWYAVWNDLYFEENGVIVSWGPFDKTFGI